MIGLDTIDQLTDRRLGTFDVPCPLCGPFKRSPRNQRKRVLRVYRIELSFAGFYCARCGEQGFARDHYSAPPDPIKLARARAEAAERERVSIVLQLRKARGIWRRRQGLPGSIGETYLRRRGYRGTFPPTLGFLPATEGYPDPAIVAAFGMARETEHTAPGVIEIGDDVPGVHLIKLLPDGSDRIRDEELKPKITIGRGFVSPIVLAAYNDLLALTIAEGVEDGLNDHQISGTGVWAAASAARMPALAALVPSYVDCVTILVDDNPTGRRNSAAVAAGLHARGIEALLTPVGEMAS
jgi:hypothetical protein